MNDDAVTPLTAPLRIALLIDHLESDYPAQIVAGLLRAARLARSRTLIVPGGLLQRSPEEPVVRNFIYSLLDSVHIDGFVISAGSLSNFCGLESLRNWLSRFSAVPCIALGLDVGTIPSVYVDNESGLYAAVSHLVEHHHRRHIGFIGGPTNSPEAVARLNAYRRALSDHGLSVDENLIRHGALGRETGIMAMTELLDQRRLANVLDAVVGVNDDVTLGATEELNRRGIKVPAQLSVVGYDDSAGAKSANPPLTTVKQHVELQAYTATQSLLETIAGKATLQSLELKSEAVIRASCGCSLGFQNDSTAVVPVKVSLARNCHLALIERRAAITAELSRAAAGRLVGLTGWDSRLLDALTRDLQNVNDNTLVREMDSVARRHIALGRDIMACHDVLSALRLQALACATVEPSARPRIEDLLQEVRLGLARIGVDAEHERQESTGLRFRILSKACASLLGAGTLTEVAKLLDEHLPTLGINAFAISCYRTGPQNGSHLTLIARRAKGVWHEMSQQLQVNAAGLDPVIEQEETLVLEPLDFDGEPVGIAALTWGAQDPVHYELLREMLGIAAFACRSLGKLA